MLNKIKNLLRDNELEVQTIKMRSALEASSPSVFGHWTQLCFSFTPMQPELTNSKWQKNLIDYFKVIPVVLLV